MMRVSCADMRDQPRDCHRRYSRPTATTHAGGPQYREDALGGAADDGPQAAPLSIPHHRNVVIIGGGSDGKDYCPSTIVSLPFEPRHPGKGPSACGYRVAPCRLLLLDGFRGTTPFDEVHVYELAAAVYLPLPCRSQFSPIFCTSSVSLTSPRAATGR
ncbi:hypothetical protein B0H13DRAFT_1988751 [Mycena leptocephala]|nr:hypothetical protein B0H13DRAFT_1988751 [Mycena leptocephala]